MPVSLYVVHTAGLSTVQSVKTVLMSLERVSSACRAWTDSVHNAYPVFVSRTSFKRPESVPKCRLRAVRIANEPAIWAGWSWASCTNSQVSGWGGFGALPLVMGLWALQVACFRIGAVVVATVVYVIGPACGRMGCT